jgi:hypothetical protein
MVSQTLLVPQQLICSKLEIQMPGSQLQAEPLNTLTLRTPILQMLFIGAATLVESSAHLMQILLSTLGIEQETDSLQQ